MADRVIVISLLPPAATPVVVVRGPQGQRGLSAVSQQIRDGITNMAPSEDAIHTALLSKVSGDGTNKITVSSTEPVDPAEGDIWFVKP